jgi:hypothetical protein
MTVVTSNPTVYLTLKFFKKSFTMVFQMLLFGECYENVYIESRTSYPS